jgi:hypothetical protein
VLQVIHTTVITVLSHNFVLLNNCIYRGHAVFALLALQKAYAVRIMFVASSAIQSTLVSYKATSQQLARALCKHQCGIVSQCTIALLQVVQSKGETGVHRLYCHCGARY